LTGGLAKDTKFVEWDWRSKGDAFGQALFTEENFPKNIDVVERLKETASRLGTTLPKLAIAWVLQHPAVAVALAGTRTPAEIEHNVGALDVKLSAADLTKIDEIMTGAAGQVAAIPM